MRLIANLTDLEKASRLSAYLTQEGIENLLENHSDQNWSSDDYGITHSYIWIIDEDQYDRAKQLIDDFKDSNFPHELPPRGQLSINKEEKPPEEDLTARPSPFPPPIQQPMGFATFYILLACVMIYFLSEWTGERLQMPLPKVPLMPLTSSPTKKALMYDYPRTYEIVDDLASSYGINALRTPETLPPAGQKLYVQLFLTPYWNGIYPAIVAYFKGKPNEDPFKAPMFEKLQEGEVWRLITPIFLHSDIFHLLFNMLWLIVLGRQMESRLGTKRLLLFIAAAAIFSNTAQYIMSGPNFIGFSGVLCGMLAYIWDRQRIAPWEGYQVQQQTLQFIFIFIFAMAGLQLFSFLLEIGTGNSFALGIANTAHLSGALFGLLSSRWRIFINN